jgi:hypothetical protein
MRGVLSFDWMCLSLTPAERIPLLLVARKTKVTHLEKYE